MTRSTISNKIARIAGSAAILVCSSFCSGQPARDNDVSERGSSPMSDSATKAPLIFESTFDLRNRLSEIHAQGGLERVKEYVAKEFTAQRPLTIGRETSQIFDVQLRRLEGGNPGDIVVDFTHNPTAENSRLLATINLVNVEPNLQLLIRKTP